ncbi:transcription elongation factor GreA [Aequitasia blattaphilus]|uniref:Transcription elongation factor GreA n=1 Tax=Aequitasia blattaphilus TaxID=2949332 RepID=A0ABT1ECJ6_9FIRM|nr:transcription elongation factor GreA [Aequitasia blattaphilus]MCP1103545.1 transcription elongation factor GreA [Aequitasia blattaphilus]MCR8616185.1 transcription elongation factor GreA [Aequitasia blattaphilus]
MREKLTKDDVKKIKEEIEYRKVVVRKRELEAVKEARAHGDLSENFEYKAAKQDKNRNESRIRYLEKMLKTAIIVSDQSEANEIGLNKKVEIRYPGETETESYHLVTSIRGNSMEGKISIESPLGKALMGKKVGEMATVQLEDGRSYEVEVVGVTQSDKTEIDEIRKF